MRGSVPHRHPQLPTVKVNHGKPNPRVYTDDGLPFRLNDARVRSVMCDLGLVPSDVDLPSEADMRALTHDAALREEYRRRIVRRRERLVGEIAERLETVPARRGAAVNDRERRFGEEEDDAPEEEEEEEEEGERRRISRGEKPDEAGPVRTNRNRLEVAEGQSEQRVQLEKYRISQTIDEERKKKAREDGIREMERDRMEKEAKVDYINRRRLRDEDADESKKDIESVCEIRDWAHNHRLDFDRAVNRVNLDVNDW
jgi:hypothetical protein